MKKLLYLMGAMALMAGMVACGPDNNEVPGLEDITLDGFYVYGEATGYDEVKSDLMMSPGFNENGKTPRDGMHEKYIWLEGGKPFQLVYYAAGATENYGAALEETTVEYADEPLTPFFRGELVVGNDAPTLQVAESGLYHIVLDRNIANDLEYAQIIVVPAKWGVRGAMNGWGYTEGAMTKNDDGTVTWTWKDCDMAAGGKFKFAYCHAWKIRLDLSGNVKSEVSLGSNFEGGLSHMTADNDIAVEKAGLYDISLTYKLNDGELGESFTHEIVLTKESELPSTMYIIGNEFGDWKWENETVVDMTPVHSHSGQFWAIRYMTTSTEFKFCAKKEWNGDFCTLANENTGFVTPGNNKVEADGMYMIFVDVVNQKIVVEPAKVYGMGDAWADASWTAASADNLFSVEGTTLTATAPNAASEGIRMYAACSATDAEWWQMEFVVLNGKIAYRGAGNDQERVKNAAGAKVVLDFNAGTGSIQ